MTGSRREPSRLEGVLAVAYRDLLEFVRDRRTMFVTLLMPVAMYPILALASSLGLRTALADIEAREAPRRVVLAVSGPDAAEFAGRLRGLVGDASDRDDWPAELVVHAVESAEARRMIDDGRADAWIDSPAGTVWALDGRDTVHLEGHVSAVRPPDARRQRHLLAVVRGLADDTRRRRLESEGLPVTVLEPVAFTIAGETATTEAGPLGGLVGTAVGGVLVLLALLTATGGFYPAIDAIAGEKERGTIETLLISPCRTTDIVAGKFLAVFAVTLVTLAVNAVSIVLTSAVLVRLLPDWLTLGIGLGAALGCAGVTLVAFTGLAAVSAAMCLAVTSASRSTKEAQNTLTPVLLLVSGLSGAALLPTADRWGVAAVPFAGQVAVARAALTIGTPAPTAADIGGRLALSLASAGVISWILLRATAASLADEELLFRGPDTAGGPLARPAARVTPTRMQGFAIVLFALAAFWYAQGIAPADLALAVPIQQAALMLPLIALTVWQRVDRARTFGLSLPGGARWPLAVVGGLLAGAGLFVLGAAATLAVRGTHLSPAARDLAGRIMQLLLDRPWWLSGLLVAVLPAVCEELFFRGWVLVAFAGERPNRPRAVAAVLVQAAAFAAFHLLPERMPQTFLLGAILGWMTLATGSIVPAVLAHMAHNAMPLVLVALAADGHGRRLAAGDTTTLPGWLVPAAAVAAIAGLALVRAARGTGPAGDCPPS